MLENYKKMEELLGLGLDDEAAKQLHETRKDRESGNKSRDALHKLFDAGIPGWLFPNTDFITSFAPFNNLPTQYCITIEGEQKWFGQ